MATNLALQLTIKSSRCLLIHYTLLQPIHFLVGKGTNVQVPCFTKASNFSAITFYHTRNLEAFAKDVGSKSFQFVNMATKIFCFLGNTIFTSCLHWMRVLGVLVNCILIDFKTILRIGSLGWSNWLCQIIKVDILVLENWKTNDWKLKGKYLRFGNKSFRIWHRVIWLRKF